MPANSGYYKCKLSSRFSCLSLLQKEILHPLHVILQSFPSLPPKAAHFLFNSFIGIITRHTDQPCTFSSEIIQSVLLLLTMVSICVIYSHIHW